MRLLDGRYDYNSTDAEYFVTFVCDYPYRDAERIVHAATKKDRAAMADLGRWHRAECHRGLARLIGRIEREAAQRARLLPVPMMSNE